MRLNRNIRCLRGLCELTHQLMQSVRNRNKFCRRSSVTLPCCHTVALLYMKDVQLATLYLTGLRAVTRRETGVLYKINSNQSFLAIIIFPSVC